MRGLFLRRLFSIVVLLLTCTHLSAATTLFEEDFEASLSRWSGQGYGAHNGMIVDDPLQAGNSVLSFSGLRKGGDVFHTSGIELVPGNTYQVSVDYLGKEIPVSVTDDFGGFFGLSDIVDYTPTNKAWLFGTREGYAVLRNHLIDDGQWHTYTYTFQWQQSEIDAADNRIHITMEDWASAGGSYGDVFFDNII